MALQPGLLQGILRLPCRAHQEPVSDADEGSVTFHRTLPRTKVTKRTIIPCSLRVFGFLLCGVNQKLRSPEHCVRAGATELWLGTVRDARGPRSTVKGCEEWLRKV